MEIIFVISTTICFILTLVFALLAIALKNSNKADIVKSIEREMDKMDSRDDWDWIYFFFDLHGTIIKPNFEVGNTDIEYYPMAKETLQLMSNRSELVLCIYTCSHEHEIEDYARKFKEDGIIFRYVNENPEVPTSGYGNYEKKPYMNVLFEDKAGFFGETDWPPVYEYFKKRYGTNKT